MRTVRLGGKKAAGRVALVDDEDYALVAQYTWNIWESPVTQGLCYARATIRPREREHFSAAMHKLITGWPLTDHINLNGLDNQRSNLRPATHSQNHANSLGQVTRTSRFKGVYWARGNRKWSATIKVDYRSRYLGLFADEEDAARAYDAAACDAWGDYALPNFPATKGTP